jgi:Zn-dependent alcohol dehydrogenase
MKASVTNGPGEGFVLEDIDIDEPIGAEVLVQIKANGLCRADSTHCPPCWAMSRRAR